ncbi:hypothetical protein PPYR_10001 [Photinus pyralis]|uniref:DUF243 domain-containing protein n=1 Tax=Photinus pyralis TaxID=7054 RepID=A0A5N4AF31_PHOPY|nr:uncharacterized protein LOC116173560 [Photinus pyralis]KAB0795940.1 hypothetical protein PPYR_10001 [Photinus pyralis]
MKTFVIVLAFAIGSYARPDVSHLPTGSYLPSGSGLQSNIDYSSGSNFGVSSEFGPHGGYNNIPQEQKHIYFFAAPGEEHLARTRINVVPSSQKNTKIIFIKAPTYAAIQPEVIAPPSISEDKTLVYVLLKKPEAAGQLTIPVSSSLKQSKPEVYFIKYKSQHDAASAIHNGLGGQPVGSSVSEVGSESNFVRTLDSGAHHGGTDGSFTSQVSSTTNFGGSSISSGSNFGPAGASGPY